MQPARPTLPEFDPLRCDPISTPILGQWHRSFTELCLKSSEFPLQIGAVGHDIALTGQAGCDATTDGAAIEIGPRFPTARSLDGAGDPHLTFQLRPEERERSASVFRQVSALV